MVVMLSLTRPRATLLAVLLTFLSITTIIATPASLQRNFAEANSVDNLKSNVAQEIDAAISSLHSGEGPSDLRSTMCTQTALGTASCQTSAVGPSVVPQSGKWNELPPPAGRWGASMVYDPADGYVVLFGGLAVGGSSAAPGVGDTWNYSHGLWTRLFSQQSPPPRVGGSMTYDALDGYVVLFGGMNRSYLPMGDTWRFSGGVWTNITTASGPSSRVGASMTYDGSASDQSVVLFGGASTAFSYFSPGTGDLSDTWKFSGGVWTNITATAGNGPSPRTASPIAYDAHDGYVVLFGGTGATSFPGDTWKFSGGMWTNITSTAGTAPPYSFLGSMAYDAPDSYILFISGTTWSFSGGTWSPVSNSGPNNRFGASVTYDSVDGYVVLFGGAPPMSGQFFDETWKFLAGVWTNVTNGSGPPSENGADLVSMITYDAADRYIVAVGGSSNFNTWKYSGGVWTNITATSKPSARYGGSMAYDVSDGFVIFTGGNPFSSGPPLRDTWKFLGGVWTNITSTAGPSPFFIQGPLVYDPADGYLVEFSGGYTPGTVKFQGGVWSNLGVPGSLQPPVESGYSMAYDPVDGYLVLFGGQTSLGVLSHDTWKLSGGVWTNITAAVGPSARVQSSMGYDASSGYVVLFGGSNNPVFSGFSDTWKFLGGIWTNITSVQGPVVNPYGSVSGPMAFDPVDNYLVMVLNGNTWTFSTLNPTPFDYSLSNNGPLSIQQGNSGHLTIKATLTAASPQPVTLSCAPTSLPTGVTCSKFTNNPLSPTASSSTVVSVASSVSPGTYSFLVSGNPQGATSSAATTSVALIVQAKSIGGVPLWTNITSTAGSAHPVGAAPMSYDALDGYVVLFDPYSPTGVQTWKFSNGVWSNITPGAGTLPSARSNPSMAYDVADGYIILFGGYIYGTGYLRDTWKFSGGVWTNITSSVGTSPYPRENAPIAYDGADGYTVLFGGDTAVGNTGINLSDTWKFSGGVWTNITSTSGPNGRVTTAESIAYDSADGYLLLQGQGMGTWKFSGGTWTSVSGASVGPAFRADASMAYDAYDGFIVLFGGSTGFTFFNDTWKYSGGIWTNITSTVSRSPSQRFAASIAYDSADNYLLLFGGLTQVTVPAGIQTLQFGDTWKFSPPASVGVHPTAMQFSCSPSTITTSQTSTCTVTVTDSASTGATFPTGTVSLSTIPTGASATFTTCTLAPTSTSAQSQCTSTLTPTSAGVAGIIANYPGDTGSPAHGSVAGTATVTVGALFDFSMSGPNSVTDEQGSTTIGFPILTTLTSGSTSPLAFSVVSGLPNGVTANFGNNPCSPTCMASISFAASTTATLGSSTVVVQASGGGVTKTISISLTIVVLFDFSLSPPAPSGLTVLQGGTSSSSSITATLTSGTSTPLTFSTSGLPSGVTAKIANGNCSPTCVVSVFFTAGLTATLGPAMVTVSASSGGTSHSANIMLTVSPFVAGGAVWTNVTSTSGPSPRFWSTMAYDAADGYVVLFGGQTGSGPNPVLFHDTWKFQGGVWTNITLTSGRPGNSNDPVMGGPFPMAYDVADGYVVLAQEDSVGHTFAFKAGVWSDISGSCTAATCPSNMYHSSMTYDTADQSILLFGGNNGQTQFDQTWKFHGGVWTRIVTGVHPTGRELPAMADDPVDGYVVLFGGANNKKVFGDTWKFMGGAWTNITTISSPPFRTGSMMTYDGADGYVILFGGDNQVTGSFGDTWKFAGGVWTNIPTALSPPSRVDATMTYDSADHYVVLFGGLISTNPPAFYHDTWTWGPSAFDFTLTGPSSISLEQGSTTPSSEGALTATLTSGSTSQIMFSVTSTLPNGVTASLGNSPCSPTCTATIGFTATSTATVGTSTVVVQASGGGVTKTVNVQLTIVALFDFSLSTPTQTSLTVTQGSTSASSSITASLVSGSPLPVGFLVTTSSLPAGITPNFTNDPCTPTCTVTVSFSASSTATPGTYTLTILASSSSPTHYVYLSLTVVAQPAFDYSLSANPQRASIIAGSTTTATITATLTSGTAQQVTLSVIAITPSPTVCQTNGVCGSLTFSPTSITLTSQGASSTMTVTTTTVLPAGTYTLTIAGSPAGKSSSTTTFTVVVTAPSFSTVSCGHNESCSVLSNSTLSNVKVAGNTLHIEADGPHGAHGYANVTVPKSEIPNIDDMHVFVDNNKLNSGVVITSNSTAYFIYFTFTFHSPVKIDIQLTAPQQTPNVPTVLGIDQTLFYEIIGGVIAAIVIVSAAVVVARRRQTKPQA